MVNGKTGQGKRTGKGVRTIFEDSDSMKERSSWCYTRCSCFVTHQKHKQEDREMLYLAIDQHRKQLTVNLRNEHGDVMLKRQVSTEWERVRSFSGRTADNGACRREDSWRSWRSAASMTGC